MRIISLFRKLLFMNNPGFNKLKLFLIFILYGFLTYSQSPDSTDISPDRPGVSTPPSVLPVKTFEIETGNAFIKVSADQNIFKSGLIANLFRYGITSRGELRLESDAGWAGKGNSVEMTALPLVIGTKVLITNEKNILPAISFLINFDITSTGDNRVNTLSYAHSMFLLCQNNLSDKFNICYNYGLLWDGINYIPQQFVAVCLGYNMNRKLSSFIEYYTQFEQWAQAGSTIDGGFAYLIRHNLQIDISAAVDYRKPSGNQNISIGVSWRIPG